jgi:hypothetical protein
VVKGVGTIAERFSMLFSVRNGPDKSTNSKCCECVAGTSGRSIRAALAIFAQTSRLRESHEAPSLRSIERSAHRGKDSQTQPHRPADRRIQSKLIILTPSTELKTKIAESPNSLRQGSRVVRRFPVINML